MLATSFARVIGSCWHDEADRSAECDACGARGRRAERQEWVERPVVVPGEAARRLGRAARGHVRVLAEEQRIEPAVLDRPTELMGLDRTFGCECGDADLHRGTLPRGAVPRLRVSGRGDGMLHNPRIV